MLAAGSDAKKSKAAKGKLDAANKQLKLANDGEGQYSSLRATRKALETPAHKESDYAPTYDSKSTGRRLALARWITSPENPLTARVAVNHVWMRHFGKPLVDSVFDFGLRAPKPMHADVLDFLASEFIESGWSFRHLHRLIVTSEAYRLSSSKAGADVKTLAQDEGNLYYWRAETRRMESQVVRDCLLQLAGTLDLTLGGPSLNVGNKSRRRSLYYKHSRDQRDKFLSMFDDADLLQCYRRSESIVPQQALALANSELSMSAAESIASRISETSSMEDPVFIEAAFETLLGRAVTKAEREACESFCKELRSLIMKNDSPEAAEVSDLVRARLVHTLLNHNDFISIR